MNFHLLHVKTLFLINIFCLQERDPIKCVTHTTKLEDWAWDDETPNHMFANYIRQSRLQLLKDISYQNSNHVLISAFVEWWQPEKKYFPHTVW